MYTAGGTLSTAKCQIYLRRAEPHVHKPDLTQAAQGDGRHDEEVCGVQGGCRGSWQHWCRKPRGAKGKGSRAAIRQDETHSPQRTFPSIILRQGPYYSAQAGPHCKMVLPSLPRAGVTLWPSHLAPDFGKATPRHVFSISLNIPTRKGR